MNEFGDKLSFSLCAGDESYVLSGEEAMLSPGQAHQSWQHISAPFPKVECLCFRVIENG